MKERDLAEQFLRDHVLAARALAALQLNQLPEEIRSRVNQAIANGTRHAELRTRINSAAKRSLCWYRAMGRSRFG